MRKVATIFLLFTLFINASLFDFKYFWSFENSYKSKNYKEALLALEKLDKETPLINYNKANTLYKLGKYNEALKYYKRAHGDDINEIDRLFNIANTFFMLKEYDNAIFTYKLILKYRDDKDVKNNLKLAYLKKLEKLKEKKKQKKEEKQKKKTKDKKSKKKSKKTKKKLTKKELLELKKMQKEEKLKRELKNMLKKNFKDKKVPVIMYKIDGQNLKSSTNLKPW